MVYFLCGKRISAVAAWSLISPDGAGGIFGEYSAGEQELAKPSHSGEVGGDRDRRELLADGQVSLVAFDVSDGKANFGVHREPADEFPQCPFVRAPGFGAFSLEMFHKSLKVPIQVFPGETDAFG
jgi:hypothetical protein